MNVLKTKRQHIPFKMQRVFFLLPIKLIAFAAIILFFGISDAQTPANDDSSNKSEEEFVNMGYISVSPKYTIGPRAKSITFKIKNNATRSIQSIFGWVYEFTESEEGEVSNFRLVNNPNKSGLPSKRSAHKPITDETWRFPLIAVNPPIDPSKKFTLLVDPKGIRFAIIEKK